MIFRQIVPPPDYKRIKAYGLYQCAIDGNRARFIEIERKLMELYRKTNNE